MSISTEYLERVKIKKELANNNQLAKHFGVTRQRIDAYYNKGNRLNLEMAYNVADALGIDMKEIAVNLKKEAAKTEEEKNFWREKLENILTLNVQNTLLYIFITSMNQDNYASRIIKHAFFQSVHPAHKIY